MDDRWLLGGTSKDQRVKSSHEWSNILKIDPDKQALFLERVLYLHDLASRRGGRSASLRLGPAEWATEVDRMALAAHIMNLMRSCRDPDGDLLFCPADLRKFLDRVVEGLLGMIMRTRPRPRLNECWS